jgi:hypothetical protein
MAKSTAASLSDVQLSLNGEVKPENDRLSNDIAMSEARAVESDFIVFKLTKSKRGRVHIDGTDDVYNPETKKVERVRLLSGVAEIWQSKQKDIDKDYIVKNRRSLIFEKNMCRIPKWDTAALEFAKVCNANIEKEKRVPGKRFEFYEYNPAKAEEAMLKKEMAGLEAALLVKDMEEIKVRELASYYNIRLFDELGNPRSLDGIRKDLMLIANRSPQDFQSKIDSAEVKVKFLIRRMMSEGIIEIGKKPGEAHFGNGTFICKLPAGVKHLDYLTSLAMTNTEEGRKFKQQLENVK